MIMLAPLCLFVYNRLDTLEQSVTALQLNTLALNCDLYIFSDAPKTQRDKENVSEVRQYIATIKGFKSVHIKRNITNKGLAQSVIDGVTEVIEQYGKVIVLEDDLVTSSNFLSYMNQAIDFYKNDLQIFSISGYTPPIKKEKEEDDVYFTMRASSWGWATWADRWDKIDWQISDYNSFKRDKSFRKQFNQTGSDMSKMLNDQMTGKINSWAIRWCYNQFLFKQYSVFPTISKVQNIGTDISATHTRDKFNRFYTELDKSNNITFNFIRFRHDVYYLRQFLKQYSLFTRVKYTILNKLCFNN